MKRLELNLRDLGGIPFTGGVVPKGLYLRSGKLSILTEKCLQKEFIIIYFLKFFEKI